MRHKEYIAQIKKVRAAMKPLTSKQRRNVAWQILLNETGRKDKEGLKWLIDNFYAFIVDNKVDFS